MEMVYTKMNLIRKKQEVNEDDEDKLEIEEIEDVVGVMVHDVSNQPERSADYSSYDDKMRLESADNSSYDDKSRIKSTEELEEINTIEKQNINKTMSEVIRNRNTIYREDIEDLEKYIEEQVVDIIERQKLRKQ